MMKDHSHDEQFDPNIYPGHLERDDESDENNENDEDIEDIIDLSQFQMRRRWESR